MSARTATLPSRKSRWKGTASAAAGLPPSSASTATKLSRASPSRITSLASPSTKSTGESTPNPSKSLSPTPTTHQQHKNSRPPPIHNKIRMLMVNLSPPKRTKKLKSKNSRGNPSLSRSKLTGLRIWRLCIHILRKRKVRTSGKVGKTR